MAGACGAVTSFADGLGTAARFYTPHDLSVASSGLVYLADFYNYRIRLLTPSGSVYSVSTLAGQSTVGTVDGCCDSTQALNTQK